MFNVMRMDLILNRNALLINGTIFGGFFLYMIWRGPDTPTVFAVFTALMVSFLPAMIVTREDKFRAMALVCSLPVDRVTVVRARYALSLFLATAGILLVLSVAAWMPGSMMSPSLIYRPATFLTAFGVSVTLISITLPFTLRFGFQGLFLALAGFQVVGIILFTLVQLSGSVIDNRIAGAIVRWAAELHRTLGSPGFHLLVVAALVLLFLASFAVSARVFRTREL